MPLDFSKLGLPEPDEVRQQRIAEEVQRQRERVTTFCVTGHRPKHLHNSYDLNHPIRHKTRQELYAVICEIQPHYNFTKAISGMALGTDQDFVYALLKYNEQYPDSRISITAAVPFTEQASMWSQKQQRVYHKLLGQCDDVVDIGGSGYRSFKLMRRNEWMIDRSSLLIAVWKGFGNLYSGTFAAIQHARSEKVPIYHLEPHFTKDGEGSFYRYPDKDIRKRTGEEFDEWLI